MSGTPAVGPGFSPDTSRGPAAGSPWWLLVAAVAWYVGAFFAALVFTGASALVIARLTGTGGGVVLGWLCMVLLVPLWLALLILGATQRARHAWGNVRAGLGWHPIQRQRLILLLVAGAVACRFLQGAMSEPFTADSFDQMRAATVDTPFAVMLQPETWPWLVGGWGLIALIMMPLAEELFFRGWLWTGLRRHWSAWTTGLVVAGLSSAPGLVGGHLNIAVSFAVPAVAATLAREFGGSVRASLAIRIVLSCVSVLFWLPVLAKGFHT